MKAQAVIISHSIVIGLSLLLIIAIALSLSYLENEYRLFAGENEASQMCSIIKYGTEKIYNTAGYTSPTQSIMGRIRLTLPTRIAGIAYRARFSNNSVYISTLSEPFVNATCRIDVNANLSGSTKGGETEILWIKNPDGQDDITMEMVSS